MLQIDFGKILCLHSWEHVEYQWKTKWGIHLSSWLLSRLSCRCGDSTHHHKSLTNPDIIMTPLPAMNLRNIPMRTALQLFPHHWMQWPRSLVFFKGLAWHCFLIWIHHHHQPMYLFFFAKLSFCPFWWWTSSVWWTAQRARCVESMNKNGERFFYRNSQVIINYRQGIYNNYRLRVVVP